MKTVRAPVASALAHLGIAALAYWLALLFVADFRVDAELTRTFGETIALLLALRAISLAALRVDEGLWQYTGLSDLTRLALATTLGSAVFAAIALPIWHPRLRPSAVVLDWLLAAALTGAARMAVRWLRERPSGDAIRRVLVVGAGDAGELLIREIHRNPGLDYDVAAIVDDDVRKIGRRLHAVQVVGSIDDVASVVKTRGIEEILLAIPTANDEQRRRIVDRCRAAGVPVNTVPSIPEIVAGQGIANLRAVGPEDLLERAAVRIDSVRVGDQIRSRRVLVTGAGGSIGSELCRQVSAFAPAELILLERAESPLYFAELELRREYPSLNVTAIVADVTNERRIGEVFDTHPPDVVYHAAAYKHVPLMEEHPIEAIRNNVFGTEMLADAAVRAGVDTFVLISTDKAVQPVGVMGMTKRVAEIVVRSRSPGPTTFVSVRFGNVLGSEGSVLPLFQWQLVRGGPVTLTDPEATRYFMLISEAAQLVLQAGAMGTGGDVFFLDMGDPVRIIDLAENLVRLSGLRPGDDVPIETTGLRPGERLHEQLVGEKERFAPSEHERILVVREPDIDTARSREDLESLRRLVDAGDREGAVAKLKAMSAPAGG
jgi:FlaA1/EpsC-like NDP-sugar epimerase